MTALEPATFEHIALAVHVGDLARWDRLLRCHLGGTALLGGAAPKVGVQGGQIDYPDGGMLEILSWIEGREAKSAMKRYVDRCGSRAALHHLTFLVDDFDARVARARELGHEPMVGRELPHWREFFVRDSGLRPAGFLVQVLQADKDVVPDGWGHDWPPFLAQHPDARPPATIAGVQLASTDPRRSAALFAELLGAETVASDTGVGLRWPGSTMGLRLVPGDSEDASWIEVAAAPASLAEICASGPERAGALIRASA
ncbi:MAG: VOC family protein [Myxococcota bacterium]|nr:VOC family protein [Myxococcota bacterium]